MNLLGIIAFIIGMRLSEYIGSHIQDDTVQEFGKENI
jgi:hypothetical protein